jgi:hypothetical protein
MVESSMRKRGKKKSRRKVMGDGGIGGYIRFSTIKSKGSSKIIGPDIAPRKALNKAAFGPCLRVNSRITINVTAAEA